MPAVIEAKVLELRRNRSHWGPMSLRHQLGREGVAPLQSVSGIYRALLRHGLIEPKARRKKLPTYKGWERGRPMELWQMDVGGVLLDDGTECKVLTGGRRPLALLRLCGHHGPGQRTGGLRVLRPGPRAPRSARGNSD